MVIFGRVSSDSRNRVGEARLFLFAVRMVSKKNNMGFYVNNQVWWNPEKCWMSMPVYGIICK